MNFWKRLKSILFLHDGSSYTFRFLFPLKLAEKGFRAAGYRIEFGQYAKSAVRAEADIIILLHDCLESVEPDVRESELCRLRRCCDTLAWLDTSDSTGTTVFDVLPFVDVYLKKQLLHNTALYTEPHYSLRYFSDYYHKAFGIDDDPIPPRVVLDPVNSSKLRVAWNILIGDVAGDGSHHKRYRFSDPHSFRSNHISFRGTQGYIPTVNFQRKMVAEILARRSEIIRPDSENKIPKYAYLRELADSRAVISPFGWGEICWRDAECWLAGAALVKPEMSHVSTWPDLYRSNDTYIPFSWDMANLDEILDDIQTCPERFIEIAVRGQSLYRSVLSETGRESFVEHLITSLTDGT